MATRKTNNGGSKKSTGTRKSTTTRRKASTTRRSTTANGTILRQPKTSDTIAFSNRP